MAQEWTMGFQNQVQEGYSAILFMDGPVVSRQMRASEFGAFLDGYVGLSDLAGTEVRAVLAHIDAALRIEALVFFRIWFDEEGRADSQWDIPIEELAKKGASGPNLGAGPIRLVCRSLCPEPRYVESMWDPDMTPGSNTFQAVRKAIAANSLKFQQRKVPVEPENIPILSVEESTSWQEADRVRVAGMLREQRLRIKTLSTLQADAEAELKRKHEQEQQALRDKLDEHEQLKARFAERNEQYLEAQTMLAKMQEQLDEALRSAAEQTRVVAEMALLSDELGRRQRELALRNDQLAALQKENHELKNRQPAEDSLMWHLQSQTVFLVAYHPGVGHLTLPYSDIERYFAAPQAYVADHCGISEASYQRWLEHYEKPVCSHRSNAAEACSNPLMRISQPAAFKPGVDDLCDDHRPVEGNASASDPVRQTSD